MYGVIFAVLKGYSVVLTTGAAEVVLGLPEQQLVPLGRTVFWPTVHLFVGATARPERLSRSRALLIC